MLLPVALWLLAGLLSARENPANSFPGSPWPAALLTLAPIALSQGDVIAMGSLWNRTAAWLLIAVVLGLALVVRSRVPDGARRGDRRPS